MLSKPVLVGTSNIAVPWNCCIRPKRFVKPPDNFLGAFYKQSLPGKSIAFDALAPVALSLAGDSRKSPLEASKAAFCLLEQWSVILEQRSEEGGDARNVLDCSPFAMFVERAELPQVYPESARAMLLVWNGLRRSPVFCSFSRYLHSTSVGGLEASVCHLARDFLVSSATAHAKLKRHGLEPFCDALCILATDLLGKLLNFLCSGCMSLKPCQPLGTSLSSLSLSLLLSFFLSLRLTSFGQASIGFLSLHTFCSRSKTPPAVPRSCSTSSRPADHHPSWKLQSVAFL